ncbi:MAG: ribulose-phosphate 3-epimerase [Ruminiclostridium sp.]|nr:ribulose-phosphate 3-epimerase [Ruminiclostridium sp.]
MTIRLSASMLASDLSAIADEIKRCEAAEIEWLHIDVMDGVFVDNITYGNNVVAAIRGKSEIFFDTHLMVTDPTRLIPLFAKAGSDMLTIHLESGGDTAENLKAIRNHGMKSGLAVKPGTPIEEVYPYLPLCDMVLVMTVEPGYGGQGFIPFCADKVKVLRDYCNENNIEMDIQVDGGINADTAGIVKAAGANVLVAGTYLFKAEDIKKAAELIR